MPQTTPQDRKTKKPGYQFTVKGKTYTLPPLGDHAEEIPGGLTFDAIMQPENEMVQLRLAFATLEAAKPDAAAMAALRSLSTKGMLEVIGAWMGESGGSSD